jgi:hypothetical protein
MHKLETYGSDRTGHKHLIKASFVEGWGDC